MINELTPSKICFDYKEEDLPSSLPPSAIVGQERAISALKVGLSAERSGYNLFVSGDIGTGRLSAVKQEVEKHRKNSAYIKDVLYVANPIDPTSPLTLVLEKGDGRKLRDELLSLRKEDYKEKLRELSERFFTAATYLLTLSRYPYSESFRHSNLALDRSEESERPFIIDSHPSFENLFGWYDESAEYPQCGIHLGSYGKASGGYLVLTAEELLAEKGVWDELKQHLDSTAMALSGKRVQGVIGKNSHIRPEPIPLNTKVILLGSEDVYDVLSEKDEQFLRLFKSSPQFDYQMPANDKNKAGLLSYLHRLADSYSLSLTKSADAALLRWSSWFAESRGSLTTQLSIVGDLLTEATSFAKDGLVDAKSIEKAIKQRDYISGITEEKIQKEIESGELLVEVSGAKVGIVNGLAVMDRGLASFGTLAVISVAVAPGTEGIVNIEHEAGLSGEIHDKGILILEGYLRGQYAVSFPLSVYAGICFEQNYSEVDGDSASSSELYALLSAIGEIPVRQDIAVTGSVNQMGLLQPVGGINEKITGFWKICKTCGLTGSQGVIIPKANIDSLILPKEVEEDIKGGLFHIWALSTIEEGMELLTGLTAGARNRKGLFPPGSFNCIIETRLKKLYEASKGN